MKDEKIRIISVSGNAKMEIEPDEVTLQITLKEYEDNNNVISIKTIEKKIIQIILENKILFNQIKLNDRIYSSSNYFRNIEELKEFKSIKILIVLNQEQFTLIDGIYNELKNEFGIDNMEVINLRNNNIDKYTKQVKIKALKSAQEKAKYLLESIGNELGKIISLNDGEYKIDNHMNLGRLKSLNTNMMNSVIDNNSIDINIKRIIITSHINVEFEII